MHCDFYLLFVNQCSEMIFCKDVAGHLLQVFGGEAHQSVALSERQVQARVETRPAQNVVEQVESPTAFVVGSIGTRADDDVGLMGALSFINIGARVVVKRYCKITKSHRHIRNVDGIFNLYWIFIQNGKLLSTGISFPIYIIIVLLLDASLRERSNARF